MLQSVHSQPLSRKSSTSDSGLLMPLYYVNFIDGGGEGNHAILHDDPTIAVSAAPLAVFDAVGSIARSGAMLSPEVHLPKPLLSLRKTLRL